MSKRIDLENDEYWYRSQQVAVVGKRQNMTVDDLFELRLQNTISLHTILVVVVILHIIIYLPYNNNLVKIMIQY